MDTHDTHLVSRSLGLHPGMVITLEPGIYISADSGNVPERFVHLHLVFVGAILIVKFAIFFIQNAHIWQNLNNSLL